MVESGRAAALWALVGFLLAFVITRAITRRIRAKKEEAKKSGGGGFSDIHIGGVHVHHQVWGILLMLVVGMIEFRFNPESPWQEILAALFGVGAALTLDEFALWLYLDDVYWGADGRKSVDAILIGGVCGTVLLLQADPVGPTGGMIGFWIYVLEILLHLATAGVCIIKGKIPTGLIGVAIPLVALVGAIRLAKPDSVWARRRYRGRKLERAQRRFGHQYTLRHNRFIDMFGGKPDPGR